MPHHSHSPVPARSLQIRAGHIRRMIVGFAAIAVVALSSAARPQSVGHVPVVVTTNTILNDLVRQIGTDRVQTRCLVPPGVDVHDYAPRPADVEMLSDADLVVTNGLGLESWVNRLIRNSGFHGVTVTASKGVTPLPFSTPIRLKSSAAPSENEVEPTIDPHAWQDLSNVIIYVHNIAAALIRVAPQYAATYRAAEQLYIQDLRVHDAWAKRLLLSLPPDRRTLVTSHDALGYLGKAYGLTIVSVEGLTPEQEPNARAFAQLVDFIRSHHARALFFEAVSNPKVIHRLSSETGVPVGGELFTDSLASPGRLGDSFLGMWTMNILRIHRALTAGEQPPSS